MRGQPMSGAYPFGAARTPHHLSAKLYEFWTVATRQAGPPPFGQNGLGMTCAQASQWLNFFSGVSPCCPIARICLGASKVRGEGWV
jgi:hypothetical protein